MDAGSSPSDIRPPFSDNHLSSFDTRSPFSVNRYQMCAAASVAFRISDASGSRVSRPGEMASVMPASSSATSTNNESAASGSMESAAAARVTSASASRVLIRRSSSR